MQVLLCKASWLLLSFFPPLLHPTRCSLCRTTSCFCPFSARNASSSRFWLSSGRPRCSFSLFFYCCIHRFLGEYFFVVSLFVSFFSEYRIAATAKSQKRNIIHRSQGVCVLQGGGVCPWRGNQPPVRRVVTLTTYRGFVNPCSVLDWEFTDRFRQAVAVPAFLLHFAIPPPPPPLPW